MIKFLFGLLTFICSAFIAFAIIVQFAGVPKELKYGDKVIVPDPTFGKICCTVRRVMGGNDVILHCMPKSYPGIYVFHSFGYYDIERCD